WLVMHDLPGGYRYTRFQELVLAHPIIVVNLTEVARAGVRNNDHHQVVLGEFLGRLECGEKRRAGGAAGKDAFAARELSREQKRILIRTSLQLVTHGKVNIAGPLDLTAAFRFVGLRLRLAPRPEHLCENRTHGIRANHTDIRILAFQKARDSCDGTACSYTDHDMGYFACGLFPNLGA